jgi:hypothetical protein
MEHVSPAVIAGYILSVLSALLCLIWGILFWNRSGKPDEPVSEVVKWAAEEDLENRK